MSVRARQINMVLVDYCLDKIIGDKNQQFTEVVFDVVTGNDTTFLCESRVAGIQCVFLSGGLQYGAAAKCMGKKIIVAPDMRAFFIRWTLELHKQQFVHLNFLYMRAVQYKILDIGHDFKFDPAGTSSQNYTLIAFLVS